MRSLIIAGKSEEKSLEKAREICRENKIDNFDITVELFEKALGIEDVRKLQKNLYLKPLRGENKALLINAFRGITIESQNALLKILEEPPTSSFIFLIVESEHILLPTILSRCKVVKIDEEKQEIDIKEAEKIFEKISSDSIGEKLKLAQDFGKTREEAVEFLEETIFGVRELMLKENNQSLKLAKIIKKLEEGYYAAKNTNVNPRFILENTLLSLNVPQRTENY